MFHMHTRLLTPVAPPPLPITTLEHYFLLFPSSAMHTQMITAAVVSLVHRSGTWVETTRGPLSSVQEQLVHLCRSREQPLPLHPFTRSQGFLGRCQKRERTAHLTSTQAFLFSSQCPFFVRSCGQVVIFCLEGIQ